MRPVQPVIMWAAVSNDTPPQIWGVHFYRDQLQENLRKIRVRVVPVTRKRRKVKR